MLLETLNSFVLKHQNLGKEIISIITDNLILIKDIDDETSI